MQQIGVRTREGVAAKSPQNSPPTHGANFAMPQRSHEVFPLSEKVNGLDLMKKKKSYAEVAKIYGKNEFSL